MSAYLREAPIYHPVLKHSRFAAKLRAGRYVRALPGDCVVLASFSPGCRGPGRGVFADNAFVERAAFIAALSLVLGIFVLVGLFSRLGVLAAWNASFVAVSARC